MAFSGDKNDILGFSGSNGRSNGLGAVMQNQKSFFASRYRLEPGSIPLLTAAAAHTSHNLGHDFQGRFAPRVIVGNNHPVTIFPGNLTHDGSFAFITIPTATKDTE